MINTAKEWNPHQARLKMLLTKSEQFNEAIDLCLEMHTLIHTSQMSNTQITTYEDQLWNDLSDRVFRTCTNQYGKTIAWNLWHLTRVEDITANILIADEKQILNESWLDQLNTKIQDTGNAMTDEEIDNFSKSLAMQPLRKYRIAVGQKTQRIIKSLQPGDLKRKMSAHQLQRIIAEKGVTEHEQSKYLVDFWGKKNVAGLLLMPITRHQIGHLNSAFKIKKQLNKNK